MLRWLRDTHPQQIVSEQCESQRRLRGLLGRLSTASIRRSQVPQQRGAHEVAMLLRLRGSFREAAVRLTLQQEQLLALGGAGDARRGALQL